MDRNDGMGGKKYRRVRIEDMLEGNEVLVRIRLRLFLLFLDNWKIGCDCFLRTKNPFSAHVLHKWSVVISKVSKHCTIGVVWSATVSTKEAVNVRGGKALGSLEGTML